MEDMTAEKAKPRTSAKPDIPMEVSVIKAGKRPLHAHALSLSPFLIFLIFIFCQICCSITCSN